MAASERGWGLSEGHEGTFWGDGEAQYLGKGLSHRTVQICQNSANVHLQATHFIARFASTGKDCE